MSDEKPQYTIEERRLPPDHRYVGHAILRPNGQEVVIVSNQADAQKVIDKLNATENGGGTVAKRVTIQNRYCNGLVS